VTATEVAMVESALAHARECVELWRGDRSWPAPRQADFIEVTANLKAARRPLTAYCRTLPRTGRRLDPLFRLNVEVADILKRMDSMRRMPPTGRPWPKAPTENVKNLDGMLHEFNQRMDGLERDHDALRSVLAGGELRHGRNRNVYRSVAELNEEAAAMLVVLDRQRRHLTKHWRRYARGHPARDEAAKVAVNGKPGAVKDEYEDRAASVQRARHRAKALRAEIAESARQRKPTPPTRQLQHHETGDFIAAWQHFHELHGRWPKKADHGRDGLPHYTQLRRTVGNQPVARMLDFVT
jgi:hypothetical protein